MRFALIWHSQYGKEEIDTFKTRTEAQRMRTEYQMAYGTGYIEVKRRRVRKQNVRDNNDNTYAPWNHRRVLSGRLDNRWNPYQAIPPLTFCQ